MNMKLFKKIEEAFLWGAIMCVPVIITACNGEDKMKEKVTKYFKEYMSAEMDELTGWTINSITFDTIGTSQYYYEVGERYYNGIYGERYQKEELSDALSQLDRSDKELQIVANLDVHPREEWYEPMTFYVGIRDRRCVSCSNLPDDNLQKLCNSAEYTIYSTIKDIVFKQYFDRTQLRLEQMGIIDRVDQASWMLRNGKNNDDLYNGFVHHDLRAFFE